MHCAASIRAASVRKVSKEKKGRKCAHSERDERRKGDEEYAGALRLVDGDGEQHVMAPHGVP